MKDRLSYLLLFALACAAFWAAGCKSPSKTSNPPQAMNAGPMTSFDTQGYDNTQPILPRQDFWDALKKSAGSQTIWKLPILVTLNRENMNIVKEAFVGLSTQHPSDQRVYVKMDDSALGVSLLDRLHQFCPEGSSCPIWVYAIVPSSPVIKGPMRDELKISLRAIQSEHLTPSPDIEVPTAYWRSK